VQNISPLVITACHPDRCLAIELTFLPKLPPKISQQMHAVLPVFYHALAGSKRVLAILSMLAKQTRPEKLEALATDNSYVLTFSA
jgi:hypothetical protein